MTLRPSELVRSRPDHSTGIVGEEGIPVRQDIDGTQIQRLGIAGVDADWGPEHIDITDDEAVIADPERVGGTASASGIIRSMDDEPVSVVFAWTGDVTQIDTIADAEADETTVVERPEDAQSDADITVARVFTKSDNCKVFVEDESAEGVDNNIEYTLNFH